jgi:imidazolonepropionase-like amidohydrolase
VATSGLIDAHVHFADLTAARVALTSGVTTVRTGGSVDRLLDMGVRELNHAGIVTVPDVVAAGYAVVRQLPDTFFLVFPKMIDLMQGVRGPDNVRRVVRALAERGANVIKILATERNGLPDTDPRRLGTFLLRHGAPSPAATHVVADVSASALGRHRRG